MANTYAKTYVKDKKWYEENIKPYVGSLMFPNKFYECSHHVNTKATKKALGLKSKGRGKKLRVFILTNDSEDFDERANPQIKYKYEVSALPSHPLGKDGEWGFMAPCPQGTAYVIY